MFFSSFDKVDYEGEDGEDEGNDEEQADDEKADDRQEEAESSELPNEESSESTAQSQRNSASKQLNIDSQDEEMRISSVLRFSDVIEDYKYDSEHGLWCEVCA